MSEHTKGPWEATSDESEPLIIAGSTTIAMCFDITGDEQKANARIIAASLDLLEACNLTLAIHYPHSDLEQSPLSQKCKRMLNAAIAKAEPS